VALPDTEQEWIHWLTLLHDRELSTLKQFDQYYEGQQPLTYMQPDIQRMVADRIWPVILFWPQLVVDSVEERLDVEGFRLPDEDAGDGDLWRVWQDNDLDEESQLGRVDALVMKRSYLAVGSNEDDADTPLVTVESPREVFGYVDPRTRQLLAALKRTTDPVSVVSTAPRSYATLYLPDRTVWYESGSARGGWKEIDRDEHGLDAVPIVPLVNRARTADRYGRSELSPVIPLADAANKICTDMMVAAEFHSIPLRAIFGIGPDDFEDAQGNKQTPLQVIMGKLLAVPGVEGNEVKPFEFTSSSLSNFHETLNQLAKLVASISGLPPDYLGLTTDNPPSAESRRAGEIRLTKRAERKQSSFGGSYEHMMRLVRRIQTGEWDPRLKRLETVWRDAASPTVAQSADAALKLYNLPKPIVPLGMTRRKLGFTETEIARMEDEDKVAAEQDPLGAITRNLGQREPA
jgi:SPP1 Gp6-like portal protein